MSPRARLYAGAAAYGALVFAASALLGLVVLPALALATGLFLIDAEARAFFSFLTLKGAPLLLGLSAGSALFYPWLSKHPVWRQTGWCALNVVLAWGIAASSALLALG